MSFPVFRRISVFAFLVMLPGCGTFSGFGASEPVAARVDSVMIETARTAEARGDYTLAVGQYRKIIAKHPENTDAFLALVRNLRYVGGAREGKNLLLNSAGLKSEDPRYLLEYAKAEIAAGSPTKAIEVLGKAAKKDPKNWDVYSTLGIAYDLADSFDEAQAAYEKALELVPGNLVVLNNMAISAALSGNLARGIHILENASLDVRRDPQVRQNLALLYGLNGDMDKAKRISEIILDQEAIKNNMTVYEQLRGGDRHLQR